MELHILAWQRMAPGASAEHGLAVPTYPRLTAVPPGQMNGSVCNQRPAMHQWNAHLLTVSATNRPATDRTSLLCSIHAVYRNNTTILTTQRSISYIASMLPYRTTNITSAWQHQTKHLSVDEIGERYLQIPVTAWATPSL